MEHYVTLFDSLYLPQALALHASMQRHAGPHLLWMLCVDGVSLRLLRELDLPDVSLLDLGQLETPELLAVKPQRSTGEYCWTLTPFAPRFVFEADATATRVTYLDADLWFRRSPAPLLEELEQSGASVLITDHAYAPEHDQSELSGQYCVQFLTFVRGTSEPVRKWWEERCIEWCYARYEDGKLGDQKYLDDWPERFGPLVHVLQSIDRLQAPWNATRFPYSAAVAYHFHGLKILPGRRVDTGAGYLLPEPVLKYVYVPYVEDLRHAADRLVGAGFEIRPQARRPKATSYLRRTVGEIIRSQWRLQRWNVFRF